MRYDEPVLDGLRIGMPSLIELEGIEAQAAACRRLGLDFVELNMNLPECVPGRLDPAALRAAGERNAVGFTLHLPEETDLAAFQPPIRDGYRRLCCEALRWAAEAGIAVVNMHLLRSVYFTLPDRRAWLYERCEHEFREALHDAFGPLSAEAARLGILLCIENAGDWNELFLTRTLEGLLSSFDLWLTWDTGHDGAAGFRDRAFLERHADRIRHMHLHDFRAPREHGQAGRSHLALYEGELDVEGALAAARRREARVVVEVKTLDALERSLSRLRERRR